MTDAELRKLLYANPELTVIEDNAPRPMPVAAQEALQRLNRVAVTLTLPYPPSVNAMYRIARNRLILTDAAKTYKIAAGWEAQRAGIAPFTGSIALYVHLYRGHKRGDSDGPLKVLLDSLNGIAYNDDDQIIEIHVWRHDDKQNPQAEIEIREVTA